MALVEAAEDVWTVFLVGCQGEKGRLTYGCDYISRRGGVNGTLGKSGSLLVLKSGVFNAQKAKGHLQRYRQIRH